MTDGIPDRLTQLRARWQADPSSRVFLQLAEEYRHLGRVQEALEVLQAGLKEHPGYLSALVAKGRCLLELGDPEGARSVLERVVQQDATQMVANKLLVRAYLEIGESDKARQRLDLYSLLNDSDPEIAELRGRVAAVSRPPQASDRPSAEEPAGRSRMDPSVPPPGRTPPVVFDSALFERKAAPRPAPAASDAAPPATKAGDVFDLGPLPAPRQEQPAVAVAPSPQKDAAPPASPPASPSRAASPPAGRAPGLGLTPSERPSPEPFPELGGPAARRQFVDRLVAEGIFSFDLPPAEPPAPELPSPPAGAIPPLPPAAAAAAAIPLPADAASPGRLSGLPKPAREDSSATLLVFPPEPPRVAASHGAVSGREASSAPQPVPELPKTAAPSSPLAPMAPLAPTEDEAAAAPLPGAAEEAVATVTLGALYLRQGHHLEAERIFREVLRREPGNAAARDALDQLAGGEPADRQIDTPRLVARLLAGFEARPEAHGQSKRVFLLNNYLDQLRRAGQRHVS